MGKENFVVINAKVNRVAIWLRQFVNNVGKNLKCDVPKSGNFVAGNVVGKLIAVGKLRQFVNNAGRNFMYLLPRLAKDGENSVARNVRVNLLEARIAKFGKEKKWDMQACTNG